MNIEKREIQFDSHKLTYHPLELSRWLNNKSFAPIYVEIGPTNICNHRCSFCALDYISSVKKTNLDKKVLIENMADMGKFGVKSIVFAGEGEPMLYKPLIEAIKMAKDSSIDVAITTNSIPLTKEKIKEIIPYLSWIKFSIDAGTKKTYSMVHGCKENDFNTAIANLRFVGEYKRKNKLKTTIGAQMLLLPETIHEVEDLILKVKDLGIDYLILKPYSQHPHSLNKKIFDIEDYDSELEKISKKYTNKEFNVEYRAFSAKEVNKNRLDYKKCYGLDFFALIDALGNVIPCNIFYGKEDYYYGNINHNKFSEIWKSQQRKEVLARLHKEGTLTCRKGCRLNCINQYLDNLKNKKIEHINFI